MWRFLHGPSHGLEFLKEETEKENYATLTFKMLRSINPNFFCVNEFCVSFLSMSTWFLMLLKSLITYFYVVWLKSMNVCKPRNNWSILINFVEMVCECDFISYLFSFFFDGKGINFTSYLWYDVMMMLLIIFVQKATHIFYPLPPPNFNFIAFKF